MVTLLYPPVAAPPTLCETRERRSQRGGDDRHDQRRPQADRDDRRRDADETPVEDDPFLPADRLRDDERGQERRGEQLERDRSSAPEASASQEHGPAALNAIVNTPTRATTSQVVLIGATARQDRPRSPRSRDSWGSDRKENERDQAARDGREDRAPGHGERQQQDEEERGKRGVEAEALGVAEDVSTEHAEGRPAHPAGEQEKPCPDQHPPVDAAAADLGDRPRLVDEQLRLEEAAQPRPWKAGAMATLIAR